MLSALLALSAHAAPVATAMDIAPAFRAAYGFEPALRIIAPPGDSRPAKLTVTPRLLAPLGGDRFALVVSEDDLVGGYHAERGAISIAYLQRQDDRWTLIRRWNELAWTGDTGSAADDMRVQRFGAGAPLLFATKSYLGNGQQTRTAWAIRLGDDGPKLLGDAPVDGSVETEGRDDAGWNYSGQIGPPRTKAAAFSITYRGWVGQGETAVRRPIATTVNYTIKAGVLAGTPKLFLP